MEHTWPVVQLNSIDSTNSHAQGIIAKNGLLQEMVFNASAQLEGKGQAGNSWESEPCTNLTFSLALQPVYLKAENQFYLTQAISLGIIDFLNNNEIKALIKWPNDILVDRKKITGILIENSIMGESLQSSVVGIGLNVNQ